MEGMWEARVSDVWRDVFQREQPPEADVNFFDAGGSSLSLLRVRALLKERFGVEVRGVDLFTYTTIEKLAAHIAKLQQS